MQINERKRAAKNAAALLEKRGTKILGINTKAGRPVIDIAFPTVRMQEKAIQITERIRGRLTTAYLHHERECGCIIRWQLGDAQ